MIRLNNLRLNERIFERLKYLKIFECTYIQRGATSLPRIAEMPILTELLILAKVPTLAEVPIPAASPVSTLWAWQLRNSSDANAQMHITE